MPTGIAEDDLTSNGRLDQTVDINESVLDFRDTMCDEQSFWDDEPCSTADTPRQPGDEPIGVLEGLLQRLLLQEGLLEDEAAADIARASLSNLNVASGGRDLISTLRQLRRIGPLGELGEDAQTTLLEGTLYEYSANEVSTLSARRTSPRLSQSVDGGVFSPDESIEVTPRSGPSAANRTSTQLNASADVRDLRLSLDRVLQLSGEGAEDMGLTTGRSSIGGSRWDSFFYSARSIEADLTARTAHSSAFASPDESQNVTSQVFDGSLVDEAEEQASVLLARDLSLTGGTSSELQFGETVRSLGSSERSESRPDTVRTILGEVSTLEEGLLNGGLTNVLRRLAFENMSFDESLSRTVHRVLQLGTVLAGQRLSDAEIQALPKMRFDDVEQQQCSICLEGYQQGELLTALRCSHVFHVDCVTKWMQRATHCPLCRASCTE